MCYSKKYIEFVNNALGSEVISASSLKQRIEYNNVIGALCSKDSFPVFRENYQERIKRLYNAGLSNKKLQNNIVHNIKTIASKEWAGAYAELCALDYFLYHLKSEIETNYTINASDTLAREMNMKKSNYDIFLREFDILMDTKILLNKTEDILNGIFKDFREQIGAMDLLIIPEYSPDDDFSIYQDKRKEILDELIRATNVKMQMPKGRVESEVIDGLTYTFAWKSGSYFSESKYSPYEHAKNHHTLLFKHAKKFCIRRPTILVFVIFPWFSESSLVIEDSKKIFLKMFCHHFFYDYMDSPKLAKNFNQQIESNISAYNVTKSLSGIIFLEDMSITSYNPSQLSINASYMWNENAQHLLFNNPIGNFLQEARAFDLKGVLYTEQRHQVNTLTFGPNQAFLPPDET
jgi:hypothetical protein